jgi:hypothetical protein
MVRPECQLPEYYALAEEAFKSWQHFIVDKLVYLSEFGGADNNSFAFVSKLYVEMDRWLELHIWFGGERESHYTAVIRPARYGRKVGRIREENLGNVSMKGYAPVFINVPEPMQLPHFRELVSIPTSVWLKRVDDSGCFQGNSLCSLLEKPRPFGIVGVDYRKESLLITSTTRTERELEGKMIQRGSKARNEVAQDESDRCTHRIGPELNDVLGSIKVILRPNSIGLAIQKTPNFVVEGVQVMLRPINLQAGIVKAGLGVGTVDELHP